MIVIDVCVPVIGKTYDFSLEENIEVGVCVDEIAELISQREGCAVESESTKLMILNAGNGAVLDYSKTLEENGIKSGDTLILT